MSQTITAKDVQTLEWWTKREVADRWRVSVDTIDRMVKRKEVEGRKFGAQLRIHRTAIEKFEQGGKPKKAPPARTGPLIDPGDAWGIYSAEELSPERTR